MATKAIASATATGASATIIVRNVRDHALSIDVTGTFSALTVDLEGSLDGSLWFVIGSSTTTTDNYLAVIDKPVSHVRVNVSAFAGGTSVTVLYHGVGHSSGIGV